ncbi:MAG: hypothetical protein CL607_02230 [Anaerolineaceae bacterium]|nr:hypothetical protein [Anaerolineaceae bacterium]
MHPVGCLWLNITLLISLVGILGPVALPSSQTETSALITPTDINYMFELENDEVTYSHKETLSCENILAGELIVDSSFVASSDIVVMTEMLEYLDGYSNPTSFTYPGEDSTYGEYGWSFLLPNLDYAYSIWVEDRSTGNKLSPSIHISFPNCDQNFALVTFAAN